MPMSPLPPFSAVLLAAGRSTRMGCDKALLDHQGLALWRRQREVLRQAGAAEIFLSARPEQAWAAQAEGFAAVLADPFPGGGPLVGVVAALERAAHPWLAVLAVDLPAVTPAWFSVLAAECAPQVGAVGRRGGYFEPLAAIYPAEILRPMRAAIAQGQFSFQGLLARAVEQGVMRPREITVIAAPLFENWNEPRA
jgi:molybdopterin-guanine dinucleotide biosynthesis protein A